MDNLEDMTHHGVIGVLVRDVERRVDGTAVRIFRRCREKIFGVELPIFVVDGVVEGDRHHLRHFVGIEATFKDILIQRKFY